MPFFYSVSPGANFTTSAVANTEIDALFVSPKQTVPTRNVYITEILTQGKAAVLTSLSALVQRVKRWTTTSSAGGTAITPSPRDPGAQAARSTAGQATAGVTSGTGGPVLQLVTGSSASGPNTWSYLNNFDAAPMVEGGTNNSLDLFNSSGAVSLVFETSLTIAE